VDLLYGKRFCNGGREGAGVFGGLPEEAVLRIRLLDGSFFCAMES